MKKVMDYMYVLRQVMNGERNEFSASCLYVLEHEDRKAIVEKMVSVVNKKSRKLAKHSFKVVESNAFDYYQAKNNCVSSYYGDILAAASHLLSDKELKSIKCHVSSLLRQPKREIRIVQNAINFQILKDDIEKAEEQMHKFASGKYSEEQYWGLFGKKKGMLCDAQLNFKCPFGV